MLDLAVLLIIAYLIYRAINLFLDKVEQLFASKAQPSQLPPPKTEPKKDQLKKTEKNAAQKEHFHHADIAQNKDSSQKLQKEDLSKLSGKKNEPAPKTSEAEKGRRGVEVSKSQGEGGRANEQTVKLLSQIESQRELITELNYKISLHDEQKKKYVDRIEQIIQQVTNEQEQTLGQGNEENKQTTAIDHEKVYQFAQQREALVAQHDNQMRQLRQQLSGGQGQVVNDSLSYVMNIHSVDDNLNDRIEDLEEQLRIVQAQKQSLEEELTGRNSSSPNGESEHYNRISRENTYLKSEAERLKQMAIQLENQLIALRSQNQNFRLSSPSENYSQQKYMLIENDQIQKQGKYQTQVQSLRLQKQSLEKQVIETNQLLFKSEESLREVSEFQVKRLEEQISFLQGNFQRERQEGANSYKKLTQAQSQLQFVQMQLNQAVQSEKQARKELQLLKNSSKRIENTSISSSQIRVHPDYIKIQQKLTELQAQNKRSQAASSQYKPMGSLLQTGKDLSQTEKRVNYARGNIQRQVSPTFQVSPKQTGNDYNYNKIQTTSSRSRVTGSTIFSGVGNLDKMTSPIDLRYKTPLVPKTVAQSSINQGGLIGESYFAETCILNESKKLFLIEQINKLKKISAKKTRLLYRSLSKYNKPLSEYISNVPNILIVIELSSKKILAAFSQAAFSRQLNGSQGGQKRYVSLNKTMILDVTEERIYLNTVGTDNIRYDEKTVVWGRDQLIISNEEPASLTCNLNCQGCIYQTDVSSQTLLNSSSNSAAITQFEVYRIFLG